MRRGFSLVELSIVLVILGLLVGGILAGKSLIRASQLRSIGTESERYTTALNAFRGKYFALPGDIANAYSFWGTGCGTNTTAVNTGCNGNGSGWVNYQGAENVKAWEHLSLAGLVEGSFDGTGPTASPTTVYVTTTDTMLSKFPEGAWDLTDHVNNADSLPNAEGTILLLAFGKPVGDNEVLGQLANFTVSEAWNVDTKLDDGRSSSGRIRGDSGDTCIDSGSDAYSIATVGPNYGNCQLYFILRK